MILRVIYIFVMCIFIRGIKTIQNISQVLGHKMLSASLIGVDTVLFLLVFKDVMSGDMSVPIVLAMAFGYIAGYYLGSIVEDKIALGHVFITLKVAKENSRNISNLLKQNGFIFITSKRYYSHKGKFRKLHKGIIHRRDLPKLKHILHEQNIVGIVENVKETFGKRIISTKEYLEVEKD